jgi:hypothetical protein
MLSIEIRTNFVELHARTYLEKFSINFNFADSMRGATGIH